MLITGTEWILIIQQWGVRRGVAPGRHSRAEAERVRRLRTPLIFSHILLVSCGDASQISAAEYLIKEKYTCPEKYVPFLLR
jgi:hypothetical protein